MFYARETSLTQTFRSGKAPLKSKELLSINCGVIQMGVRTAERKVNSFKISFYI